MSSDKEYSARYEEQVLPVLYARYEEQMLPVLYADQATVSANHERLVVTFETVLPAMEMSGGCTISKADFTKAEVEFESYRRVPVARVACDWGLVRYFIAALQNMQRQYDPDAIEDLVNDVVPEERRM